MHKNQASYSTGNACDIAHRAEKHLLSHALPLTRPSHLRRCQKRRKGFGSNFLCQASAPASQDSRVQKVKSEIASLSGDKNGTDRSSNVKERLSGLAQGLADLKQQKIISMTGSKWKLVFTESLASSAGKLGPFVGKVIQEFPADRPGIYINWLYLGPATISLLADYKQSGKERIDVSFQYLQVELGIWKWKKDLKNEGTWDSIYIDDTYRVFRANQKNLFVLEKLP